jgi:rubrerythrin
MSHQHGLTSSGEILRVALESERRSRDFYAGLAATCSVDFVRELLEKLQNEEAKHAHLIEGMIARLESGRDPI